MQELYPSSPHIVEGISPSMPSDEAIKDHTVNNINYEDAHAALEATKESINPLGHNIRPSHRHHHWYNSLVEKFKGKSKSVIQLSQAFGIANQAGKPGPVIGSVLVKGPRNELQGLVVGTPRVVERFSFSGKTQQRVCLPEPLTCFESAKIGGIGRVLLCGTQGGHVCVLQLDTLEQLLDLYIPICGDPSTSRKQTLTFSRDSANRERAKLSNSSELVPPSESNAESDTLCNGNQTNGSEKPYTEPFDSSLSISSLAIKSTFAEFVHFIIGGTVSGKVYIWQVPSAQLVHVIDPPLGSEEILKYNEDRSFESSHDAPHDLAVSPKLGISAVGTVAEIPENEANEKVDMADGQNARYGLKMDDAFQGKPENLLNPEESDTPHSGDTTVDRQDSTMLEEDLGSKEDTMQSINSSEAKTGHSKFTLNIPTHGKCNFETEAHRLERGFGDEPMSSPSCDANYYAHSDIDISPSAPHMPKVVEQIDGHQSPVEEAPYEPACNTANVESPNNEICETKDAIDNQWYVGALCAITPFDQLWIGYGSGVIAIRGLSDYSLLRYISVEGTDISHICFSLFKELVIVVCGFQHVLMFCPRLLQLVQKIDACSLTTVSPLSFLHLLEAPEAWESKVTILLAGSVDGSICVRRLERDPDSGVVTCPLLRNYIREVEPRVPISSILIDSWLNAAFVGDASGVVFTLPYIFQYIDENERKASNGPSQV